MARQEPGKPPVSSPVKPRETPTGTPALPGPKLPAAPGGSPQGKGAEQLVHVKMLPLTQRVSAGETFDLAFVFEIEPQWHIYWKNSGSSGSPTEIQVTGPQGFTIGKARYPRPVAMS